MLMTLRYAFRSIRSAPLASGVVVLCIGLSIGATTTVFAWTEHLVQRPLPAVAAVERVVSVGTRAQGSQQSVSYPDYLDWRDRSRASRRWPLSASGSSRCARAVTTAGAPNPSGGCWSRTTTSTCSVCRRSSGVRSRRANRVSRRRRRCRHQPSAVGAALRRRRGRDRPACPAQWHRHDDRRGRSARFRRNVCRPLLRRLGPDHDASRADRRGTRAGGPRHPLAAGDRPVAQRSDARRGA